MPSAELVPPDEKGIQSDERDMGCTYDELGKDITIAHCTLERLLRVGLLHDRTWADLPSS